MSERRPHLAVWFLVLATTVWGLSFPLTKAVSLAEQTMLPGRSSWFYSAHSLVFRMGLAALVLAVWRPRMLARITRLEWKQGVGLGFFLAGGALLQNDGLLYTDASISAFLTTFYCVILPIVAALVRRAWPQRSGWRSRLSRRGGLRTVRDSCPRAALTLPSGFWSSRPRSGG